MVFILSALASCGLDDASKRITEAAKCADAKLGDKGKSVIGEYSEYQLDGLKCIIDAVEMPDWVRSELAQTRPIDGRRSAEWEGVIASWSYNSREIKIIIRNKEK